MCGRHGGLLVSAHLQIKLSRFEPWPETLHLVLGQNTLLAQCLSPPRLLVNLMQGVTTIPSGGGGSRNSPEGGVEIVPVASCHRNWDELQPDWPQGLYADLTCLF